MSLNTSTYHWSAPGGWVVQKRPVPVWPSSHTCNDRRLQAGLHWLLTADCCPQTLDSVSSWQPIGGARPTIRLIPIWRHRSASWSLPVHSALSHCGLATRTLQQQQQRSNKATVSGVFDKVQLDIVVMSISSDRDQVTKPGQGQGADRGASSCLMMVLKVNLAETRTMASAVAYKGRECC